jgi:Na+-transporting methylmalonyl-CoA/oxaloacetate decarboxylase gamma subunit
MTEGLTVIAAGLVVVLCIMASMFLLIEVILKVDQVLRDRAERVAERRAALEAKAAPERQQEDSRGRNAAVAAIALALQQHLDRRVAPRSAAAEAGAAPTPWASSGRLEIMTERQRVTSRRG